LPFTPVDFLEISPAGPSGKRTDNVSWSIEKNPGIIILDRFSGL